MIARALVLLGFVVGLASPAHAENRIKLAVLGLEVAGSVDFESTTIARNLTGSLRGQCKTASRYQVAPNSNTELIDEKVANSCDSEATACMAKIGTKLGARALLYGRIEKRQRDGLEGYQLALKLLDTESQIATPYATWIPLGDAGGSELDGWAAKAFRTVTETTAAPLLLKEARATPIHITPTIKPSAGWRAASYASTGAALVLGGTYVYAWQQLQATSYGKLCTEDAAGGFTANSHKHCGAGARNRGLTYTAGPLALAAAGLAIYATYKGFISSGESAERTNAVGSSRRKRTRFAVTPIVSPDGAGATVRLDW